MAHIGIFTKDVLSETDFQNKLQLLGYEVFCSKTMLESVLKKRGGKYLELFPIMVISQTIFLKEEVQALLSLTKKNETVLLQISEERIPEEFSECEELGYIKRIRKDISLIELKETMAEAENTLAERISKQNIEICQEKFIDSLSKNERKVFFILFNARGNFVNRDQLSQQIWPGEVTDSRLVQLSQLIAKIRKKLVEAGFSKDSLSTNWTKGYAISTKLLIRPRMLEGLNK
ncbi:winged helix-turn-helix domain-containing protein [Enterococcus sp. HY326]|uniref:winged helix-turn-helix domain-containing protein n=1 Tax=Enterococcus sp. HY326 TaxID=2971265 RepID=UPI00223E9725|nr:helix-turn-helix domain-containing protein [Enterococcus sp. HY326]